MVYRLRITCDWGSFDLPFLRRDAAMSKAIPWVKLARSEGAPRLVEVFAPSGRLILFAPSSGRVEPPLPPSARDNPAAPAHRELTATC